jgi:glycosyltransferase involved in cell wall biosynthesis
MHLNGQGSRALRSVLQVGKYYPPYEGGIENHVASLCSGVQASWDTTALVFNTEARTLEERVDGVRVVRVASLGNILSTEFAPSFIRWFSRLSHADIVHLHVPNPVGELACLSMRRGFRLVVTYHSDVVRQRLLGRLNRMVLHRVLNRADRIIVFTRRYMESSPVLRWHSSKCAIIPHGIDLSEVEKTAEVAERAAGFRRQHGDRVVLFVGRMVYYKGLDVLLHAMTRLPDTKLVLLGDGPLRRPMEKLSGTLGLGSRVHFCGRVDHLTKVAAYHGSDLLVLPATHRSEAFGLVQVEAMAAGLPVICTNIDSGVPSVNAHGQSGLVIEPGRPDHLAEAIRTMLGDRIRLREFGLEARRRAERLYSREVMLRDTLALYDGLLREREAVPGVA